MELIRGIHNLKAKHQNCVATIGGFDGLHLGHQALLTKLCQEAKQRSLPSLVITFEPLPAEYFAPDKALPRLSRLREKLALIGEAGIDRTLCIQFNHNLAQQSADDFVDKLLVQGLNIRYLMIGQDFRFGHQRQGDFDLLRGSGNKYGFEVDTFDSIKYDEQRISSTRIRESLLKGDLNTAANMLGRPFSISGKVIRGDQRGQKLGFPTANVHIRRRSTPLNGVFAIQAKSPSITAVRGVANIGIRPTFEGKKCLLEAHLFDFEQMIYGELLEIRFLHKIRDEKRFASINQLKQAIQQDCIAARHFFANKT